ncbi:MGMT family protein [Lactococcus kimchii]|uniref:MGMT family protein n=1 Tax=Lactococcus sp. S-13 TaxID=2507158 RepID=UPI001022FA4A|nr:MGMT family protein [Lactococcus sp. S-13]RZI49001.1 MGMT family protein [Lactococcus sp. S-13]
MAELTENTKKILAVIQAVPQGEVMSYRDVGKLAGLPNAARQVSWILHSMSHNYKLPWWRIIRSDGTIALPEPGRSEQIALLQQEGVSVSTKGKVNIKKSSTEK